MPIPTAATLVQEFLTLISDGRRHLVADLQRSLQESFQITSEESSQRIPCGRETVLSNRFRNAKFSMRRRGLVAFDDDGTGVTITDAGRDYLVRAPKSKTFTVSGPHKTT